MTYSIICLIWPDNDIRVYDFWNHIPCREKLEVLRDEVERMLALSDQEIEQFNDDVDVQAQKDSRLKMLTTMKKNGQDLDGFVYVANDPLRGYHKIGFSKKPETRERQLRLSNAGIRIIKTYPGSQFDELELHRFFRELGKFIDAEWFDLTDLDLQQIDIYFSNRSAA